MKVSAFDIKGPLLIEPKIFGDERGFFVERFKRGIFSELGIKAEFVQDNYSRSSANVLRGLHFQFDQPQAKLVTAAAGTVLDVIVDIRQDSPTFGRSLSVELDGARPKWFWVPAGFAHAFLALSREGADLMYKVDAYYNPQGEGGIRWNDPDLAIDWPIKNPEISSRDAALPSWAEYRSNPKF